MTTIQDIQTKLTTEFGVTETQVKTLRSNLEAVITDMFNSKGIQLTDDALTLIKRRTLEDTLTTMQDGDFPLEHLAETPEEFFENITTEIQNNGKAARHNVTFAVSSLRDQVPDEHPVNEYTTKLIGENYEHAT